MFSMLPIKDIDEVRRVCKENNIEFLNTYATELIERNERTGLCIYDIAGDIVKIRFISLEDDKTLIMTDTMLRAVLNRAELAGCKTAVFDEGLKELLEKLKEKRGFKDETDINSLLHSCKH